MTEPERGDRADDDPGERTPEGSGDRMRDVSHTPPHGDGANRVWDGTRVYDRDADDAVAPRNETAASRDEDGAVAPRDGDDRAASRGGRSTVREGDDE